MFWGFASKTAVEYCTLIRPSLQLRDVQQYDILARYRVAGESRYRVAAMSRGWVNIWTWSVPKPVFDYIAPLFVTAATEHTVERGLVLIGSEETGVPRFAGNNRRHRLTQPTPNTCGWQVRVGGTGEDCNRRPDLHRGGDLLDLLRHDGRTGTIRPTTILSSLFSSHLACLSRREVFLLPSPLCLRPSTSA